MRRNIAAVEYQPEQRRGDDDINPFHEYNLSGEKKKPGLLRAVGVKKE
jgi:hypothetical protein